MAYSKLAILPHPNPLPLGEGDIAKISAWVVYLGNQTQSAFAAWIIAWM